MKYLKNKIMCQIQVPRYFPLEFGGKDDLPDKSKLTKQERKAETYQGAWSFQVHVKPGVSGQDIADIFKEFGDINISETRKAAVYWVFFEEVDPETAKTLNM